MLPSMSRAAREKRRAASSGGERRACTSSCWISAAGVPGSGGGADAALGSGGGMVERERAAAGSGGGGLEGAGETTMRAEVPAVDTGRSGRSCVTCVVSMSSKEVGIAPVGTVTPAGRMEYTGSTRVAVKRSSSPRSDERSGSGWVTSARSIVAGGRGNSDVAVSSSSWRRGVASVPDGLVGGDGSMRLPPGAPGAPGGSGGGRCDMLPDRLARPS